MRGELYYTIKTSWLVGIFSAWLLFRRDLEQFDATRHGSLESYIKNEKSHCAVCLMHTKVNKRKNYQQRHVNESDRLFSRLSAKRGSENFSSHQLPTAHSISLPRASSVRVCE